MSVDTVLVLAITVVSSTAAPAQSSVPPDSAIPVDCHSSMICPGEELVYEVSWMSVPLGQIRLKTIEATTIDGQRQHKATGYVDSYDGLPFVDIHAIDHTSMDDSMYSLGFDAIEKTGD